MNTSQLFVDFVPILLSWAKTLSRDEYSSNVSNNPQLCTEWAAWEIRAAHGIGMVLGDTTTDTYRNNSALPVELPINPEPLLEEFRIPSAHIYYPHILSTYCPSSGLPIPYHSIRGNPMRYRGRLSVDIIVCVRFLYCISFLRLVRQMLELEYSTSGWLLLEYGIIIANDLIDDVQRAGRVITVVTAGGAN